ncbi:ABC transporter [Rhodoplanes elegans]|uniref:ABC transporter n=2 Tax=Rhodoplanes elegans TaxID=29408 RepID=A0A327KJW8_9BRAD|nr:ATP-binding cassette domain-containing protein [Rhodoplanes elegans]MBK5960068.1 ABC transporter [Rhodoplanes elegans]RAI39019.1 ABC transporter [Rhodoplanes elegans]
MTLGGAAALASNVGVQPPLGAHLDITDLSCRLSGLAAVDRAAMTIHPGEHVALVGANGAGKSTLLRAILGLQPAIGGRVALDGKVATSRVDWDERRRLAPWVPQRQAIGRFPLTVDELLASSGDRDAAGAAAARLGIVQLGARPLHALSGGQLQRCFLARAFGAVARGGRLLLADEPTAALDFATRDTVAAMLRELPVSVLVATHDKTIADQCDRVVEMADGRLREWRA